MSFRRIRLRQPVWSFTPITIFYENFLFVNYRRLSQSWKERSPKSEKKKQTKANKNKQKQTKTKSNAESIYLENFRVLFLRNPRELGFLRDFYACSPIVLKNMFITLMSKTQTTNRFLSLYSYFSPCYLISHHSLFLLRWLTTVEALSL